MDFTVCPASPSCTSSVPRRPGGRRKAEGGSGLGLLRQRGEDFGGPAGGGVGGADPFVFPRGGGGTCAPRAPALRGGPGFPGLPGGPPPQRGARADNLS